MLSACAAIAANANVLLEDDFSSGVRNVQNLPNTAAWYYSSNSRLVATPGALTATVDSSRLAIVYFSNSGPYTLSDGETLRVAVDFTAEGVNSASTGRGLRVGLFHFADGNRLQEDDFSSGNNGSRGVVGYLLNMNFSTQFRITNPLEIRRRNGDLAEFANNDNLMGSVPGNGLYGAALGTGGTSGAAAFASGVRYTLEFIVTRNGNAATVTTRFSQGGNIVAEATGTDNTAGVTAFDSFAIRFDGSGNTASTVVFHGISVTTDGDGEDPEDPEDPVDPVIVLDPDAFLRYLASSTEIGNGWLERPEFGAYFPAEDGSHFIYLPGRMTWMHVLGTSDEMYYMFHDAAHDSWWATSDAFTPVLRGFNTQRWYFYNGQDMVALGNNEEEELPPVEFDAMPPIGYATVAGMGVETVTGGKGGPIVYVNTIADLKREAAGSDPKIIVVSGTFIGADSISVGSNKTILGAHPGATFRGIGFEMRNVSNVILRNLRISNVLAGVANDGDCIRVVDRSHHIWIDHCEVFNDNPFTQTNKDLYDGLIDITNGSDFVTISWTHLHNHHKFILIGSTDTASRYNDDQHLRVTIHHSILENPFKKDSRLGTRVPSVRFGKAHIFNCIYRNLGEGIRSRHPTARVRVEENVFDYLGYAWVSANGGEFTIGENLMINEANKNARVVPISNPDFVPPYAYTHFMVPAIEVEDLVMSRVGVGKIDPFDGLP